MKDNNPIANNVDRRSFLKSTGVTAGVATLGVGSANAKSIGDINFIEVGLNYTLEHPESAETTPRLVANDDPPEYVVDTEQDKLQLTALTSASTKETFVNNGNVVSAAEIDSFPNTVTTGNSTRFATVQLSHDFRPVRMLSLLEKVEAPSVSIEAKEKNSVSISNVDIPQVPEKAQRAANVKTKIVKYEALTDSGKVVTEKAPMKSQVVVRNHGRLTLMDAPES